MVAVLELYTSVKQPHWTLLATFAGEQKLTWFPGKLKWTGSVLVLYLPFSKVMPDKTFLLKYIEAWLSTTRISKENWTAQQTMTTNHSSQKHKYEL